LTLYGIVGYADGRGIVTVDWYWGLRMSQFFEGYAKNRRLFAVEEEGAELGFGG
jgi:hypothetical protein